MFDIKISFFGGDFDWSIDILAISKFWFFTVFIFLSYKINHNSQEYQIYNVLLILSRFYSLTVVKNQNP